jgi:sugar phosphate isomerase/epimerase
MTCINAVSFHEDPSIESICRKVRSAGFDTIELSRPPFFSKLTTAGTRARFSEWAAELNLQLYGFDCWVDVLPYTAMEETLDGFRTAVNFAKDLQLRMLISHDPWMKDNGERSPAECLRVNIELFRKVADISADAELDLVFEPHPDTLSMNNRWCIDFIDGLERSNVGILFDCCHYGVGQPDTYLQTIDQLGSRIRHLHFSDGDRLTYALHLPLGDGELDLTAIIRALRAIPFRGTITNDLFNYPLLEDGARRNAPKIKQLEEELASGR